MLVATLLGATLASIGAGASSLAYFTDTSQSTAGAWTSGTITLGVTPSTTWGATNILPGDTGRQTIHVVNSGTGQLRYAMTTAISGTETKALSSQMTLAIASGVCPATGAVTGDIYSGSLAAATIGNLATHTGRTLASSASEDICFYWGFNSTAGNAYQGGQTGATFSFAAEQTANNP